MIKPKKSLGQNFLVDQNILKKIVNYTNIENETVLEIGPGTGNLSSHIFNKNPKKIFLIEKDIDLIEQLETKFNNKVKIINEDILQINEKRIDDEKFIVFGNLPYNISTEILCKWILNLDKNEFWFKKLILMFQKEVADRILAKFNTSNYGRLSILSNWKLNITKIFDVKPSSFFPKPKIDSTLLFFEPKKNFLNIQNPYNLEKITRVFFNHRRKMIKKPYNIIFENNKSILNKLNITLNLRPQNLDCDTYYKLTNEYEKLRS